MQAVVARRERVAQDLRHNMSFDFVDIFDHKIRKSLTPRCAGHCVIKIVGPLNTPLYTKNLLTYYRCVLPYRDFNLTVSLRATRRLQSIQFLLRDFMHTAEFLKNSNILAELKFVLGAQMVFTDAKKSVHILVTHSLYDLHST